MKVQYIFVIYFQKNRQLHEILNEYLHQSKQNKTARPNPHIFLHLACSRLAFRCIESIRWPEGSIV